MQKNSQLWADHKKTGRESLQKFIIILLAGGVITITLTSPLGVVGLARVVSKKLGIKLDKKLKKRYSEDSIRSSLYRLKKNQYVKQSTKQEGDKFIVKIELTKKGKELFQGYNFHDLKVPPLPAGRKWDGKWRFVIYDISEGSVNTRNIFRDKLKKMKFFMVQRSVWVHPYPCKKEIEFITEFLGLKDSILLFEAKVEKDKRLKTYFRSKGFKL